MIKNEELKDTDKTKCNSKRLNKMLSIAFIKEKLKATALYL